MSFTTTLKPIPGFCVKSKTLQAGSYKTPLSSVPPSGNFILGQSTNPSVVPIPLALKVFINIAWDSNVPPPPEGVDIAISNVFGGVVDEHDADRLYIPVVISHGLPDTDKAGNPALTFDAVFSSSLKPRALKDSEFKLYIIELALQRIEAQASLPLSRQISFPNIASKGNLRPRTVRIPSVFHHTSDKILIEELPKSSGIPNVAKPVEAIGKVTNCSSITTSSTFDIPSWSWTRSGDQIMITIFVPRLTHLLVRNSILELEPRRVLLHVPTLYFLDVSLDLSETVSADRDSDATLTLRRMRDLDVDGGKAQWRVSQSIILLTA